MIGPGRIANCPTEGPACCACRTPVDAEAIHHAFVHHLLAAAAAFLGRLEDDRDGAGEVAGFGEIFRRTEKHRGVAVMAAGVHLARNRRRIRLVRGLDYRQRVHVGAQAHRRAGAEPALDDADDAGPGEAGRHLVAAEILQPRSHEIGRLVKVEAEFRRPVDMTAPAGDLVLHFGGSVQYRHCLPVLLKGRPGCPSHGLFAILASHRLDSTKRCEVRNEGRIPRDSCHLRFRGPGRGRRSRGGFIMRRMLSLGMATLGLVALAAASANAGPSILFDARPDRSSKATTRSHAGIRRRSPS